VYLQHLSSLQFLTYAAFFAVLVAAVFRFVPGRRPPVRTEPYSDEEIGTHDAKLAKYFVAGALFLVIGSVHMAVKNLPWAAEWLARAGHAGHLVRDLSNTHLIIVGGGTLIATGLCWYVLPRIVGRPLASDGLAQAAFWFTALGLALFYVALVANGIAIGRLVEHGWDYQVAKEHMGKWYKVPVGAGAGVMGIGYWCFAANVFLTVFQARLVRVPRPDWHLWKFLATGAAALTVGTVQGVIQVQPANANWLYKTGHAGEWIDPISHAHINLVTGLTMLGAGVAFYLIPRLGGRAPSRHSANAVFFGLLGASLTFYAVTLYLGLHEGHLVVRRGLTPEQAEEQTPLHPYLIMFAGVLMFAFFWWLLALVLRAARPLHGSTRVFILGGAAALGLGTLQGPIQAVPAVNELLDRGGDAGDVIVNLHAQLNMIAGLLAILTGLTLAVLERLGARRLPARTRLAAVGIVGGMMVYYAAGIGFAAVEAHGVTMGRTFASALSATEPWQAVVLVPAALAVLAGFGGYATAVWPMTARQRREGRRAIAAAPAVYTGRIPKRVRRRHPAALAGYELPLGLLGFPGVGWLFAGFPFTASILLLAGPALTWAVVPAAFSPYGQGPLRGVGWKVELVWLPVMAVVSSAALYRAQARRRARELGEPPRQGRRHRGRRSYRARVTATLGGLALVLLSLPFIPAVAGVGSSSVRYSYQHGFTREVTGQFLTTQKGTVKLFSWNEPREPYPADALRLHSADARVFIVRAAAVDDPAAYQLFDLRRGTRIPLAIQSAIPTQLELTPRRPLPVGRYALVSTHEGMFGGKDFAYVTIVKPGAPVTAISSGQRTSVPAIAKSFPPVAAALVALLFALLLGRSFLAKRAGAKALWAAGFTLFATAAAAEAVAQRTGWTPGLFRIYYLAGGVLTVAYLGAGSAWLQLPRRARDWLLGALAAATVAAVVTVALAPVDAGGLRATATGRPPANDLVAGHAFLWAVALNSIGTAFLVGGALYSIVRRRRARANAWIGAGAIVVALATGLSRTGAYSTVYLGELVGIALMFVGFKLVAAPAGTSAPERADHAPEPKATLAPAKS
jgi:hypothetical protein